MITYILALAIITCVMGVIYYFSDKSSEAAGTFIAVLSLICILQNAYFLKCYIDDNFGKIKIQYIKKEQK